MIIKAPQAPQDPPPAESALIDRIHLVNLDFEPFDELDDEEHVPDSRFPEPADIPD